MSNILCVRVMAIIMATTGKIVGRDDILADCLKKEGEHTAALQALQNVLSVDAIPTTAATPLAIANWIKATQANAHAEHSIDISASLRKRGLLARTSTTSFVAA